jgi:hypothetical protein
MNGQKLLLLLLLLLVMLQMLARSELVRFVTVAQSHGLDPWQARPNP